jgi:RNA polymerase sigma-70 factor, ECF subfamily
MLRGRVVQDEARLITLAARGDRVAFEELVRGRQERVFWTAFQIVGDEEEARDVSQQVFIRLWTSLAGFRPDGSFESWLHRVTVNLAIDAWRRRRARRTASGLDDAGKPEPVDPAPGPADRLESADVQRIFLRLAGRLSPQQRAVFVLREMNGLDSEEIARVLGLSASTVRNHLHQARRLLRRGLAALYPEYSPRDKGTE